MAKQTSSLLFQCYIWLVETIYSAGHITRKEIDRRWARNTSINTKNESAIPERTFHNWKNACEDLFHITIACSRSLGRAYYIENADDLRTDDVRTWLVNTLAMHTMLAESQSLQRQIILEPIPSGQRFLFPLIEAIRDQKAIRMVYQSFHKKPSADFLAYPYCVKVFKQRWYLVAASEGYSTPHIYSLDRILSLTPTDTEYQIPSAFDGEAYFAKSYGVIVTDQASEKVQIKANAQTANYLRTLPLHPSQTETERHSDYSIFEFRIAPTFDFSQELRTHGACIEVLQPQWLRDEFTAESTQLYRLYHPQP